MDTFIKLIRSKNYPILKSSGVLVININGAEIPFSLREATRRISTSGTSDTTFVHTGILIFKAGTFMKTREWRDGKSQLEEQLPKIMARLELDAVAEVEQMERARQWREKYENEIRTAKAIQQEKEQEHAEFKKLLVHAERYSAAEKIRQYVKATQSVNGTNTVAWAKWATDKADWYDPVINRKDEILGKLE